MFCEDDCCMDFHAPKPSLVLEALKNGLVIFVIFTCLLYFSAEWIVKRITV